MPDGSFHTKSASGLEPALSASIEGDAKGDYGRTLDRVEYYFDRTATQTWERLTSEAPVSGIRATVRAGRDRMRETLLTRLTDDLTGKRVLDAGCGTGALAVELAARGAEVIAVDISPALIEIAKKRCPEAVASRITFLAGDMLDASLGHFDHVVAMDSLIYYDESTIADVLDGLTRRTLGSVIFTLAPRTPLLMAMWRIGKLFPRADRSPVMIPQNTKRLSRKLTAGKMNEIARINAKFYISTALEITPC